MESPNLWLLQIAADAQIEHERQKQRLQRITENLPH
jgi:hypothetical protein